MNGDVGGQNDLNQLNPANIERIEIVKGAASSLYGSDAIAGVINIITKRNREKMELTNTSRIGEYGDIRQSTSFGFNYGKIKSVTGINFRHTDGWRNTDLQWDQNQLKSGSTMLTVNRSSNYTLSENIEWQVNRKLDLTAEGTYYERWVMRTHGPATSGLHKAMLSKRVHRPVDTNQSPPLYHARFQVCVYKAHQTNVVAMKNFLSEKTKDAVQTKNL